MEVLFPHSAGIDVHKKTAVAAVGYFNERGELVRQTRTFSTMTGQLEAMVKWFLDTGVTHVAMESTGVYWWPVHNVLEEHFTVVLANARHVKAVPGRKTDVRDAEWLLELMQHGLITGSFIPPAAIRQLREFTRYRRTLVEDRTREINRVQKVLEGANIKLAAVATNIMGVSGRAMLQAIIDGDEDAAHLADMARYQLRRKLPQLQEALHGRVQPHHRFLLKELLAHIDFLDQRIAEVSKEIEERTRPFEAQRELVCAIPGMGDRVFEVVVAEIGVDMSRFPSVRHLCSWAALCPANNESAGKKVGGVSRHGNNWLRAALLQAAWAATRTDGYLRAQYRHIARRRGEKRAAIAVAHSLLAIIYHVLSEGAAYRDLGPDHFQRIDVEQRKQYLVKQLAQLGYQATLEPTVAA
ncbi:MAG TPA: IS110 family transposase [Chloroflexota bacterium]